MEQNAPNNVERSSESAEVLARSDIIGIGALIDKIAILSCHIDPGALISTPLVVALETPVAQVILGDRVDRCATVPQRRSGT
jgi:hypothetical protein